MTPTKTLLLVEDEGLVRHDLKEGLVEAGFDSATWRRAERR
jgi:hypothetical protein